MDFALSQDQRLLQDSLNGTLERICPLGRVRAFAEATSPSPAISGAGSPRLASQAC